MQRRRRAPTSALRPALPKSSADRADERRGVVLWRFLQSFRADALIGRVGAPTPARGQRRGGVHATTPFALLSGLSQCSKACDRKREVPGSCPPFPWPWRSRAIDACGCIPPASPNAGVLPGTWQLTGAIMQQRSSNRMGGGRRAGMARAAGGATKQATLARPARGASLRVHAAAAAAPAAPKTGKKPTFPFTRIQGQEEMKLALCLNVVDPNIGGVLIMGDRGTGKSVAVRASKRRLLARGDALAPPRAAGARRYGAAGG
eukprot:355211-Chlamydomonas_euryale.AAC.3